MPSTSDDSSIESLRHLPATAPSPSELQSPATSQMPSTSDDSSYESLLHSTGTVQASSDLPQSSTSIMLLPAYHAPASSSLAASPLSHTSSELPHLATSQMPSTSDDSSYDAVHHQAGTPASWTPQPLCAMCSMPHQAEHSASE